VPPAAGTPAGAPPSAHPELYELAKRFESADPDTLGARLAEAEQKIRSASTPPDELAEAGRVQQAAYRQLVGRPEWRAAALAKLPESLRPGAEANIEAGSQLRVLTKPQDKLPPWRIVAPPPPAELLSHYKAAEAASGIGWQFLAAIHLVESRMGRIRGTSTAGAQGPMQFLPSTWAAYGEGDINDPGDAIMAAARYLKRNGGPSDMGGALYAYNHSQKYVTAIELYAGQMRLDERAYYGYHQWQVYYRTTAGDALLPEGYQG
jgi:hypothetical protein